MKNKTINTTPKIRLTGDCGATVEIDVSNLKASEEQKKIVQKFLINGDLASLTSTEQDLIKDLKAYVGLGTVTPAFIVRFDSTWIKIDES